MSNVGFASGQGPDRVDMSLDDIIRLNKREQQTRRKGRGNARPLLNGRSAQGKGAPPRAGGPIQRGGGVTRGGVTRGGVTRGGVRLGGRGRRFPPPVSRHRGQGVITGLAARKTAALQKGISPLNRPAVNQQFQKKKPFVQSRPFIQSNEAQYRQADSQRKQPYRQQTNMQRGPNTTTQHRPTQLRRRPLPPAHQNQREAPQNQRDARQNQRDARQATFLSRRGLKVHAEVQKPAPSPPSPVRTRQWRTSTNSSGILTVSIDNPTARTQPEPPSAWALHPPAPPSPAPLKMEVAEEEKKPPKGVPLQFDINSVAKPTMTLNERFRILKDQRTAHPAQESKGSRFVTVG